MKVITILLKENSDKKGLVRLRVLLNLMECMDFPLPSEEAERIRAQFTLEGSKHQLTRYREVIKALNYNSDTNKWQVRQGIEIGSMNTGVKLHDRFRSNNEQRGSKSTQKKTTKAESRS
jgi:hypothetical protein